MNLTKIAIIGAGSVGSTTAYALLMNKLPVQILLCDIDQVRCSGEIDDLSDALSFSEEGGIIAATTEEAAQADIIVIAAGARQKIGQTRIELLQTNKKVIASVIEQLKPLNPHAKIIMVTNPLDILTYYAQNDAGLPQTQVFGTGTFLDTQRLRLILSKELNVAQQSIHTYVLGEHGDTQFPVWSLTTIGEIPLLKLPGIDQKKLDVIAQTAKDKAYQIIKCKGSTYFGIATCVATICKMILFDEKRIVPLSVYIDRFGVCLSLPCVLGKNGIEQILDIPLSDKEQKLLAASAHTLKKYIS